MERCGGTHRTVISGSRAVYEKVDTTCSHGKANISKAPFFLQVHTAMLQWPRDRRAVQSYASYRGADGKGKSDGEGAASESKGRAREKQRTQRRR